MKNQENRTLIPPCEMCSPQGTLPKGGEVRYKGFREKVYERREEKFEQG